MSRLLNINTQQIVREMYGVNKQFEMQIITLSNDVIQLVIKESGTFQHFSQN